MNDPYTRVTPPRTCSIIRERNIENVPMIVGIRNRSRINRYADNGSVRKIYRTISRETKKNAHGARLKVVNLSLIGKSFNWFLTIDWIRGTATYAERGREEKNRREEIVEDKGQKEEDVGVKSAVGYSRGAHPKSILIARFPYLKYALLSRTCCLIFLLTAWFAAFW